MKADVPIFHLSFLVKGAVGDHAMGDRSLREPTWASRVARYYRLARYTVMTIRREVVREILSGGGNFRFNQYVSHWTRQAKVFEAYDVSSESVGSEHWKRLAEPQFRLLQWAGLREDWVIVEIGCGNGKIPYMLEREKAIPSGAYYGFDIIEECIEDCRRRYSSKNFHFNLIQKPSLDLQDEFADCIFLMSVFTHTDEATIHKYLGQIRKGLKSNGVCIFSVHLIPESWPRQVSISIAQYPFATIRRIISDLQFQCYTYSDYPPLGSETYVPGLVTERPYGQQFLFVVSKTLQDNPKLTRI